MDYAKESLRLHGEWKGKIEVVATVPVATKDDLSLAYTPGVAQPCLEIQKDGQSTYESRLFQNRTPPHGSSRKPYPCGSVKSPSYGYQIGRASCRERV